MPPDLPPRAQMLLVINADGSFGVQGPLDDKILCYGMLEAAKDAIRDHHAKKAQSPLLIGIPPMPRMNGSG